jgi:alpha-D-xyloside xylohydrolase
VSGNRLLSSYSLLETGAIADGLRASYPRKRPFTLTRASWAGQQRTGGALWTGDIMGTWPVLRRQVAASINFGLSGMPYWSQDIGGFHRPGDAQYTSVPPDRDPNRVLLCPALR